MYGVLSDKSFILKCLLQQNPIALVSVFLMVMVGLFARIMQISEASLNDELVHLNYADFLWETVVVTTTGKQILLSRIWGLDSADDSGQGRGLRLCASGACGDLAAGAGH